MPEYAVDHSSLRVDRISLGLILSLVVAEITVLLGIF